MFVGVVDLRWLQEVGRTQTGCMGCKFQKKIKKKNFQKKGVINCIKISLISIKLTTHIKKKHISHTLNITL